MSADGGSDPRLMDIKGKRVLVTGGAGFLGSWLVEALSAKRPASITVPRSRRCDLRDADAAERLFRRVKPQLVIHAAARSGGIDFHLAFPAEIFRNNTLMTMNMMEASRKAGVEKLVLMGSSCAYPGQASGLLREEELLSGPLHPSVAPFGFSKRAMLLGAQAYRSQYQLNAVCPMLTNLYGPGDDFGAQHTHVVAALIRRFVEAVRRREQEVVCWGSGRAERECLFVRDAAEGVVRVIEGYDDPEPLNIGTGRAIAIEKLAEMIGEISGFRGKIIWDASKPDGAMKKVLNVARMERALHWRPSTDLREGLTHTIRWFEGAFANGFQDEVWRWPDFFLFHPEALRR